MSYATRDGRDWKPDYLVSIDAQKCIGCGRCYKVCGREVMTLKGINEDGELVELDDDDEVEKKVMVMNDDGACIGCGACVRVCPTNCQTHVCANAAGAHMSASPFLGPS
ncbi:ferredoxin III, nif-specific [Bradyrhizobium sp. BEA-2-5]|uniref:ferredoxin III, nif-specific n=1 Tax=Bradyrhizobium sp. BEA-2-5 TaxID=3080015 RepID=UPI00293E0F6A|nr:ferredoxin III, nif-specific [Bradyrhizobium sp. BEA-2-5]WOH80528.1 ferredoxin III, nif-specific [Bradyrhizobium sp. BEA-2-5]